MMDILPNTVIHDLTAQSGHPVQILVLLGCASCFAGKPGQAILACPSGNARSFAPQACIAGPLA
jgi:hypothetical protein